MKSNAGRYFWGIVLVLAGGYFMAEQFGIVPVLSDVGWSLFFAVLSAGFFTIYFTGGMRDWGLLFPSFILAGIAGTIWLANSYDQGNLAGGLIMWSIALPFWTAWLSDRKTNWWATIPGWALTALGAIIFFDQFMAGEWIGALVLWSIALPFLVVYLRDRSHWWALIPAYSLGVIGLIVASESLIGGEMIGALVLFSIALPFLVVYMRDRSHWWPLIPAGVMSMAGFIVLLEALNTADEAVGGVFMAGLGIVFLVIFALYPTNWWAIIPGGILLSLSATIFSTLLNFTPPWDERLPNLVAYGGMGLTFAVLWLQRGRYRTAWAKYPAVGLVAFGVLAAALGQETAWPIVLIAVGAWLLLRGRTDTIEAE